MLLSAHIGVLRFIKIEFDRSGNITGASILTYLLEKSRIVRPQRNERNYHIFYRLLSGASEQQRKTLRLTVPQDYYYLRQSECAEIEDVDDAAEVLVLGGTPELCFEFLLRLFLLLSLVCE